MDQPSDWKNACIAEFIDGVRQLQRDPSLTLPLHKLRSMLLGAILANEDQAAKAIWENLYPQAGWSLPLAIGGTASLEEWCRANAAPCTIVEPSQDMVIERTSIHGGEYRYRTITTLFATLPDAQWIPGWDCILARDGTAISDSPFHPFDYVGKPYPHCYVRELGMVAYHRPPAERYIDEEVIFVSAPGDAHFGHWMCDFLPRLLAVNQCDTQKIAVPSYLSAKHMDTLKACGVPESDILRCDVGYTYRFRKLHYYRPGACAAPHPTHLNFLRVFLARPATAPRKGNRIFLGRSSVGTREVANREEFEALLKETGFTSVDPAHLSLKEQQVLFGDAEVLLGVFGSNLLGLYFAPPGCKVICMSQHAEEMKSADPWLPAAAAFFQQEYQLLQCRTAEVTQKQRYRKDVDIIVDCEELRRRLD